MGPCRLHITANQKNPPIDRNRSEPFSASGRQTQAVALCSARPHAMMMTLQPDQLPRRDRKVEAAGCFDAGFKAAIRPSSFAHFVSSAAHVRAGSSA
jgi:hypothetical protein